MTATDVAHALNVSQPSISRAFHRESPISSAKRKLILEKSIEMGYKQDQAKKILLEEEQTRLAFVVGEMHNPFFSSLMKDFSHMMEGKKYHLLSIHILENETPTKLKALLTALKKDQVRGIFAASISPNSTLPNLCSQFGMALVLINRPTKFLNVSAVACDNQESAYQVAKFLHHKNHSQFAFITSHSEIPTFEDRLNGVQDYLKQAGLPELLILKCQQNYRDAYQVVVDHQFALRERGVTAVIGGNDLIALGALDALRHQLDVSVPEEMAVFGFDDIPMASWDSYQLSTIRQRTRLMSEEAFELMRLYLEQNLFGLRRLSQGQFVIRKSC